jgi:Raf kinase inhibitor-like YbhB/YbcL family protein
MCTLKLILIIMAMISDSELSVKSPAFINNGFIPAKYTCDNASINPPLEIHGIPENAKSLALIMDDPDAPSKTFDHWIMWNIPVTKKIGENSAPGVQGKNGREENKYTGPCPPSGVHHYHFRIYALDTQLDLGSATYKNELLKAMDGHILAMGELIGLYKREK